MVHINNDELNRVETLEDDLEFKKWWELEAFWILFKDCQKMGSSMLLSISLLIQAIEWEWNSTLEEYLKDEWKKIVFSDETKNIFFLWIATFLSQYKNKEDREKDKEFFEKLYNISWDRDWIERPKYDWEFEYNWKYYLVLSPKRPMWSEYDEFLELISTPNKYLDRINLIDWVKDLVKNILCSK